MSGITFISTAQCRMIGKLNNLKAIGAGKQKYLNMIATISYGHMCLREEKQRPKHDSHNQLRSHVPERGETKDLNMIATISYGHMCLREEKQMT